jgi:hypothetical protein
MDRSSVADTVQSMPAVIAWEMSIPSPPIDRCTSKFVTPFAGVVEYEPSAVTVFDWPAHVRVTLQWSYVMLDGGFACDAPGVNVTEPANVFPFASVQPPVSVVCGPLIEAAGHVVEPVPVAVVPARRGAIPYRNMFGALRRDHLLAFAAVSCAGGRLDPEAPG